MAKQNCYGSLAASLKSCAGLAVGLTLLCGPAFARDWYVDGKNGQESNSGGYAQPFLYFWQANQQAEPGDNIYLAPTITYPTLWINASGSSGHPITISGTGPAPYLTKVSGFGANFGISIGASYVSLQNLDVTAPGTYSAIHAPEYEHDIEITHNVLHDAGYNGIDMIGNDYVTISYNKVYNNAKNTTLGWFASGISVKGGIDVDDNTGAKIFINGNIVYNNTNTPACSSSACWSNASDSDGSGIILDNNRRDGIDNNPYKGFIQVSNNVVFGNGGRGLHIFKTDHVLVDGNTLYSNNQDPFEGNYRPGEIEGNDVSAVSILNNIVTSDGGEGVTFGKHTGSRVPLSVQNCTPGEGPIYVSNNLGYRPQNDAGSFLILRNNSTSILTMGNIWGIPQFAHPTSAPAEADLRVLAGSPAIGNGTTTYAMYNDLLGARRHQPTSIGAYENAAP